MSTAGLAIVEVIQPDIPSMSLDHGETKAASFAESFAEGAKAASPAAADFAAHGLAVGISGAIRNSAGAQTAPRELTKKAVVDQTAATEARAGNKTALVDKDDSPPQASTSLAGGADEAEIEATSAGEGFVSDEAQLPDTCKIVLQSCRGNTGGDVAGNKDAAVAVDAATGELGCFVINVRGSSDKAGKLSVGMTDQTVPTKKPDKTQQLAKAQAGMQGTAVGALNLSEVAAPPFAEGAGQAGASATAPSDNEFGKGFDKGFQEDSGKSLTSVIGGAGRAISQNTTESAGHTSRTTTNEIEGKSDSTASVKEPVSASGLEPASSSSGMMAKINESSKSGSDDVGGRIEDASGTVAAVVSQVAASAGAAISSVGHTSIGGSVLVQKTHAGEEMAHGISMQAGDGGTNSHIETGQSADDLPRMLTATPTALEVGIQNGTHGWLKVRAEIAEGGTVNASVSAASSAGQEMLHRELPALTAYLQQEKVAVSAVMVQAPVTSGIEYRGSNAEMSGGSSQQGGGEARQQPQQDTGESVSSARGTIADYRRDDPGGDAVLPTASYLGGGGWLSVRA